MKFDFLQAISMTLVALFALFLLIAVIRFVIGIIMSVLSFLLSPLGVVTMIVVGGIIYAGYLHNQKA